MVNKEQNYLTNGIQYFFKKTLIASSISALLFIGAIIFCFIPIIFSNYFLNEGKIAFYLMSAITLVSSIAILLKDAYFYHINLKYKNFYLKGHLEVNKLKLYLSAFFCLSYYYYASKYIIANTIFWKTIYLQENTRFLKVYGRAFEISKLTKYKDYFKLDIIDITISGIFLAIFLLVRFSLGKIGLSFEFLFYIIVAYFLRYYKAAFLAFIADFLGLFISGGIREWFWAYAIVPIISTLIISLVFDIFEKNKKIAIFSSNIILWLAIFTLFFVYLSQTLNSNLSEIKISKTFGLKQLSSGVFIAIVLLGIVIIAFMSYLSVMFFIKKQDSKQQKWFFFLLHGFAIVALTVIVFRWIWGPFAFIWWKNWSVGKTTRTISEHYVIVMLPIVARSILSIPIYTFILITIMTPLVVLRKGYLEKKLISKY
ncbi:hypothetical protein [Mycoplasmopsis cricetuli]|uniref:hypothetical protein n=1 Tax=Mycoplasmopsis cricetuli TaxID=171283 RepID=UPI000471298D|nr:hypothetical protein [Mycoplasmopsis cricetuli]